MKKMVKVSKFYELLKKIDLNGFLVRLKRPLNKIKVIDVIRHKNISCTHEMVVINRIPDFRYEENDGWLIGEDSGFYSFYFYRKEGKYSKAFAGREFLIKMKDGSEIKADGQWWDGIPEEFKHLTSVGCNTIERLGVCNVFISMYLNREIINEWLKKNNDTNNYNKYNKKSKDYMVQTITVSGG